MSLFDWLLVSHLVGDFLLQTDGMAYKKPRDWSWMLRHIASYMVPVTLVVAVYAWDAHKPAWLAIMVLLFIAITHLILDRRKLVQAWMSVVGVPREHPWLPILTDQIFHVLTLVVACQILLRVGG
ncbi:MAG: DUF3307 domain-containing protein [Anaerolineae bacterium]|jgi:hypothetical protein